MDITEIFPTIAEIAVAIAGFSAIIVALRKKPIRKWHELDQFNFRMLLQVAALTIFFSMFPFLTLVFLDPPVAWKLSVLTYGFVHLVDVSSFIRNHPGTKKTRHRIGSGIAVAISLVQIGFGLFASTTAMQVIYLVTLIWHLAVSSMGFALLIYAPADDYDA
jgi:hypothetical protein